VAKSKPPRCSICADKNRCAIDLEYIRSRDQRGTARKFKVSEDALWRHIDKGHISEAVKASENVNLANHGLNMQTCAQEIYEVAVGSAKDARAARQFGAVGSCLNPAAKVLEILNKGNDKDDDRPGIDRAVEQMKHDRDVRRAKL
jgi:hypothetical protein